MRFERINKNCTLGGRCVAAVIVTAVGSVLFSSQIFGQAVATINGSYLVNSGGSASISAGTIVQINPCASASGATGTSCSTPISEPQWPRPQMSFTVGAPYNTSSYNLKWTLKADYSKKYTYTHGGIQGNYTTTAPTYNAPAGAVAGNQTWTPTISASIGGNITVTVVVTPCGTNGSNSVPTAKGTLQFKITGVNPDIHQIAAAANQNNASVLANGGWFFPLILADESGAAQFVATGSNAGYPTFGPPDGIGLMQLEPTARNYSPNVPDPYWNFQVNIADSMKLIRDNRTQEYPKFDTFIDAACRHAGGTPSLYTNSAGTAHCSTNFTGPDGTRTLPLQSSCPNIRTWAPDHPNGHIQDINWIQAYNGFGCGRDVQYNSTLNNWDISYRSCTVTHGTHTYPVTDYVHKICGHTPAY